MARVQELIGRLISHWEFPTLAPLVEFFNDWIQRLAQRDRGCGQLMGETDNLRIPKGVFSVGVLFNCTWSKLLPLHSLFIPFAD